MLEQSLMVKKYIVRLSAEERIQLGDRVKKSRVVARKRRHAEILLKADKEHTAPPGTTVT